jgi:hypothetical protein
MNPEQAKQENPPGQEERSLIGELQRFTDPPGGAPLDDPEVRARKRCGRPADQPNNASPDAKDG